MPGKPCTPSVSAGFAATSTMCASGAIACAHWTSRLVSSAQPTGEPFTLLLKVGVPFGWMIWTVVRGRPKVSLNRGAAVRVHDHNRLALTGRPLGVQRIHTIRRVNVGGRIGVENCCAYIT